MTQLTEDQKVELNKLANFKELGYTHNEALDCIALGIDWHEVANLVKHGCPLDMAIEIAR